MMLNAIAQSCHMLKKCMGEKQIAVERAKKKKKSLFTVSLFLDYNESHYVEMDEIIPKNQKRMRLKKWPLLYEHS